MHAISKLPATLIFLPALLAAVVANANANETVSCTSEGGARQYCDADTRNGVMLTNQRSRTECTQGYSWGYDERGIWVDHGCRADFTVSAGGRRGERAPANRDDRRNDGDRYANERGERRYPDCSLADEGVHWSQADNAYNGPNCGKHPTNSPSSNDRSPKRPECKLDDPGVKLIDGQWVGPNCGPKSNSDH